MKPCKALLAGAAMAGGLAASAAWSQDRGFYVGGSLGRSEMKDSCKDVTISCDKTDKAWKIFGGYQFTRRLAAELGYTDLGETKASGVQGGVAVNGNVSSKRERRGAGLRHQRQRERHQYRLHGRLRRAGIHPAQSRGARGMAEVQRCRRQQHRQDRHRRPERRGALPLLGGPLFFVMRRRAA